MTSNITMVAVTVGAVCPDPRPMPIHYSDPKTTTRRALNELASDYRR